MSSNQSNPQHQRYAWLVFAFSAGFLFYKYVLQVSPSVMTDDFMRAFDVSGAGLGVLVGFYFYTYMIMQIPSGIILDKYGPHRPTTIAIAICAIGAILLANTHQFALACLARLMMGFGAAFGTTSYMKLASQWFAPKFFPLLSGFFGTACMLGAAFAEAPAALLVDHIGWRATLITAGLVGFTLMLGFFFAANPKHRQTDTSEHKQSRFQWRDIILMLKRRNNIALILYGGLAFTPATVFGGLWGVPFLIASYGVTKSTAASSISLVFFGFAFGSFTVGFIGKALKRFVPIMLIGTSLATLMLTAVIYLPHLPYNTANLLLALYGFLSAGFLMAYPVAKNTNAPAIVATVIGVFNMGDPLCGAIADPIVGKVLDWHWHGTLVNGARVYDVHAFHIAFILLIAYLIASVICGFFINESSKY